MAAILDPMLEFNLYLVEMQWMKRGECFSFFSPSVMLLPNIIEKSDTRDLVNS